MDTIIWLAVCAAVGVLVWLAAPHHHGMIENRDTEADDKPWD